MLKLGLADVVGTAEGASESTDGLAETDGEDDGMLLGATDGPELGRAEGDRLGPVLRLGLVVSLGFEDGMLLGEALDVGTDDGSVLGISVGRMEGT